MSPATSPFAPAAERSQLSRVSAALVALAPQFATAVTFLAAWIAPARMPPAFVRGLLVAMLLEFLLLHSYAFLNLATGVREGAKTGERLRGALAALGFGAFYLLMAGAIGLATQSMMPVWTILWLVGSRIFEIVVAGEPGSGVASTRTASWLRHLLLFIVLLILTAVVPLPALGLSSEVVAGLELSGSGVWVEKPQSVLAFGFLYFGLGAYFDLRARLRR